MKGFLADSNGHCVATPRSDRKSHRALRRKQRHLSRRQQGRRRRRKAARTCAKTHLQIKRQRRDFLFKTAKPSAENYARLCVEDLNITGMRHNHHLAKSLADAAWGTCIELLEDKAARAGHQVVKVPARFTTQKCFRWRALVPTSRSVRTPICPEWGCVEDRDTNAAKHIFQAGAPPRASVRDTGRSTFFLSWDSQSGSRPLPAFFAVDTRNTLNRARLDTVGTDGDWSNEIHPNTPGYRKLGAKVTARLGL